MTPSREQLLLGHVDSNSKHEVTPTRLGLHRQVTTLVEAELRAQMRKWGQQNHAPSYWLSILGEEYGEICRAFNEGDSDGYVNELIQTAAVCIAQAANYLEQIKIESSDMPQQKAFGGTDEHS